MQNKVSSYQILLRVSGKNSKLLIKFQSNVKLRKSNVGVDYEKKILYHGKKIQEDKESEAKLMKSSLSAEKVLNTPSNSSNNSDKEVNTGISKKNHKGKKNLLLIPNELIDETNHNIKSMSIDDSERQENDKKIDIDKQVENTQNNKKSFEQPSTEEYRVKNEFININKEEKLYEEEKNDNSGKNLILELSSNKEELANIANNMKSITKSKVLFNKKFSNIDNNKNYNSSSMLADSVFNSSLAGLSQINNMKDSKFSKSKLQPKKSNKETKKDQDCVYQEYNKAIKTIKKKENSDESLKGKVKLGMTTSFSGFMACDKEIILAMNRMNSTGKFQNLYIKTGNQTMKSNNTTNKLFSMDSKDHFTFQIPFTSLVMKNTASSTKHGNGKNHSVGQGQGII